MFGVSFPELLLIGAVALIIVGPQRLPGMLGTLGKWSNKLRRMLFDVRQQSGIDDILRAEGISGGLNEIRALRNAVRGNVTGLLGAPGPVQRQGVQQLLAQARAASPGAASAATVAPLEVPSDPYADVPYDRTREYPEEGCDAYGAIPDDLWAASHPEPSTSIAPLSNAGATSVAPLPTTGSVSVPPLPNAALQPDAALQPNAAPATQPVNAAVDSAASGTDNSPPPSVADNVPAAEGAPAATPSAHDHVN